MQTDIPLGEKLKQIRVAKGLPQDSIAHALKISIGTISRIESGQLTCDTERLAQIKKVLEIENAPLFEHEREVYRANLLIWRELIIARRVGEARARSKELSSILSLPFELDLRMLYLIIECQLLMTEDLLGNDLDKTHAVENILAEAETVLDKMCSDGTYLFYYMKGRYHGARNDFVNAIKYFLLAVDFEGANLKVTAQLLMSLGVSYLWNAQPLLALIYLERANTLNGNLFTTDLGSKINAYLAIGYRTIAEYGMAKKISEKSLVISKSHKNDWMTIEALTTLGIVSMKQKNFEESINLFDEALRYAKPLYIPAYVSVLYHKAECLFEMKKLSKCLELVEQGKAQAGADESLSIRFEALGHLMTLIEADSCEYIENIAIPYFRNHAEFGLALMWCDKLEAYYIKRGAHRKAANIVSKSRDIYRKIVHSE